MKADEILVSACGRREIAGGGLRHHAFYGGDETQARGGGIGAPFDSDVGVRAAGGGGGGGVEGEGGECCWGGGHVVFPAFEISLGQVRECRESRGGQVGCHSWEEGSGCCAGEREEVNE